MIFKWLNELHWASGLQLYHSLWLRDHQDLDIHRDMLYFFSLFRQSFLAFFMLSWVFDVFELSICSYKAEENIGLLLAFSISSSDPPCYPWSVKENSGRLCQKWQPIESGWAPSRFTGWRHEFWVFPLFVQYTITPFARFLSIRSCG